MARLTHTRCQVHVPMMCGPASLLFAAEAAPTAPASPVVAWAGLGVIALAAVAVLRKVDVRAVLSLAALALGLLAGQPQTVVQTFLATLSREQFVIPICTAMGFAYVLRQTECDRHLVHLLAEPVRRVRFLLVPGLVLIAFQVNIPIVSQTSTAATVGPVMLPLLRAAGIANVTAGGALLLGASIGGELLNPGAPEFRTISSRLDVKESECVTAIARPLFLHVALAALLFWGWNAWLDAREKTRKPPLAEDEPVLENAPKTEELRVNFLKALIPLVPLALLFLTDSRFNVFSVNRDWLAEATEPDRVMSSRLVGLAMLVGVAAAALVGWRSAGGIAKAFFEGAGYAFTNIISLIVCAYSFGKGVEVVGLASVLGDFIKAFPALLIPCAAVLPLVFAVLCGSGFAATQSLFGFFVEPARALGVDPLGVGAVVSLSAAAGRSMSPVGAVNMLCAQMTETTPFTLACRVAPPMLISLAATLVVRGWMGW